MRRRPASWGRLRLSPLAALRKKAAARQANTTALAKLASSRKELGAAYHALATHTQAAPASSRVHRFFTGRQVAGSSAPPIPAPRPRTSMARGCTWTFSSTEARPRTMLWAASRWSRLSNMSR